jgi:hypothetical protein
MLLRNLWLKKKRESERKNNWKTKKRKYSRQSSKQALKFQIQQIQNRFSQYQYQKKLKNQRKKSPKRKKFCSSQLD